MHAELVHFSIGHLLASNWDASWHMSSVALGELQTCCQSADKVVLF